MRGAVVVGVDGSPSSLTATEQAAEEASLRGVGLHVVLALAWPAVPIGTETLAYEPAVEALHSMAERFVADAVSRARTAAPDIEVTSGIVPGEPLSVLVDMSHSALMLAVGSRGLGSFTGLLLGSVAVHVAAHAHCPVLVSRGTSGRSGAVVLGADGSAAGRPAAAFAFAEASLRGAELIAAHVWSEWNVPPTPPQDKSMAYAKKPGELHADEERLLAESLSGWCEKYPDVQVERHTVRGRTREGLIDVSKGARLLVVGTRGRGGFAGMLLGSVSQAALHHAHCPVVVVPQEAGPPQ